MHIQAIIMENLLEILKGIIYFLPLVPFLPFLHAFHTFTSHPPFSVMTVGKLHLYTSDGIVLNTELPPVQVCVKYYSMTT
jgi:hypothetical protein